MPPLPRMESRRYLPPSVCPTKLSVAGSSIRVDIPSFAMVAASWAVASLAPQFRQNRASSRLLRPHFSQVIVLFQPSRSSANRDRFFGVVLTSRHYAHYQTV